MSTSTHVMGFTPPDENWHKMKAVYDSCLEAGVPAPIEVDEFFDPDGPDEQGQEVNIDEAVEKYEDEYSTGLAVDLSKLPERVKYIRFFNTF